MGAVMVGDRVAKVLVEEGGEFNHGFTYSGHPVACAVAIANITLMQNESIVKRIHDNIGPYLQRRWAELADHPLVGETRGKGLVAALEIVQDKQTNSRFPAGLQAGMTCREFCFNNGLVMRAVGDTMIISPPLVITEEQVDELVNLARLSLDLTAAKLKG
jgi:putrescine aminotransferase